MISFIDQPTEWREFLAAAVSAKDSPDREDGFDDSSLSPKALVCSSNRIKNASSILAALDLRSLLHLNLSFNSLTTMPSLDGLHSLQHLDISHNKLDNIGFLQSLSSLIALRLHHNRLETILPISFTSDTIEELWISDNKLDWLEFSFLRKCRKLRVLIKRGNPSDGKAKLEDYLQHILPSLSVLDEKRLTPLVLVNTADSDEDDLSTVPTPTHAPSSSKRVGTEKIPTDIRVMITQAKGFYQQQHQLYATRVEEDARAATAASQVSNSAQSQQGSKHLRTRSLSNKSLLSLARHDAGDNDIDSQDAAPSLRRGDNKLRRQRSEKVPSASPTAAAGGRPTPLRLREANSVSDVEESPKNRSRASAGKGILSNDTSAAATAGTPKSQDQKYQQVLYFSSGTNKTSSTGGRSSKNGSVESADAGGDSGDRRGSRESNASNDVALCRYVNGDGFLRWHAGGTVACRVEQKGILLTAQFPEGQAAVVCDRNSHSAVFSDPQGKSLCKIRATVTESEIKEDVDAIAEVFDPISGHVLASYRRSKDRTVSATSDSELKEHKWSFPVEFTHTDSYGTTAEQDPGNQTLTMAFSPETWEVSKSSNLPQNTSEPADALTSISFGSLILFFFLGYDNFCIQVRVEVGNALGRAVASSISGLKITTRKSGVAAGGSRGGIMKAERPRRQSSSTSADGNVSSGTSHPPLGRSSRPSQRANTSTTTSGAMNGPQRHRTLRQDGSGSGNRIVPPPSDLDLSTLNSNLDDLLANMKQLHDRPPSSNASQQQQVAAPAKK